MRVLAFAQDGGTVVASSGQSDDLAASIVSANRISLQRASIGQKIILKYQAIWGILVKLDL